MISASNLSEASKAISQVILLLTCTAAGLTPICEETVVGGRIDTGWVQWLFVCIAACQHTELCGRALQEHAG